MYVSGQFHTPTALPPSKKPYTHWIGCWVGPRDGLDILEKRKGIKSQKGKKDKKWKTEENEEWKVEVKK
jgi:hypothetical protein